MRIDRLLSYRQHSTAHQSRPRRGLLRLACAAFAGLACLASLPAGAQAFPTAKPVTLYVTFPAGGVTDITMRTLAEHFKRLTGQTMIIENRPGGGSTVALNALRQQKPDGYTLSVMGRGAMTTYWIQDGKIGFHPIEDLTYVSGIAGSYFALVARADQPYKTLAELVAFAKANPGKLTFGTIGHGQFTHQPMAEFLQLAGIDIRHVPFKGDGDTLNNLAGGHLELAVAGGSFQAFVDSGKARLLGFLTDKRVPRFADTPTFTEQGYPVRAHVVVGIGGPKGTDPQAVRYLDGVFKRITDDPEFRASLDKMHQTTQYMSHDEFSAWARKQFLVEKDIVEKFNLRAPAK